MIKNKKGEGTELGVTVVEVLIAVLVIGLLAFLIYAVVYASSRDSPGKRAEAILNDIAENMNAIKGNNGKEFYEVLTLTSGNDWKYLVYVSDKTSASECINAEDYFPGQGCICIFSMNVDDSGCSSRDKCSGYCRNAEFPVIINGGRGYDLERKSRDLKMTYKEENGKKFFIAQI